MTAGVYAITCQPTGESYIGQSCNIEARWKSHVSYLRGGYHHNPRLGKAWNQYGESAFSFAVIEEVQDLQHLRMREKHHIACRLEEKGSSELNWRDSEEGMLAIHKQIVKTRWGQWRTLHPLKRLYQPKSWDFATLSNTARILHISRPELNRLVRCGVFTAIEHPEDKRAKLIAMSDIRAYQESRKNIPKAKYQHKATPRKKKASKESTI